MESYITTLYTLDMFGGVFYIPSVRSNHSFAHTQTQTFFFCFICFLFCHRDKNDFQRVEDQLFQMTITAKMPEIESLKYPWGT